MTVGDFSLSVRSFAQFYRWFAQQDRWFAQLCKSHLRKSSGIPPRPLFTKLSRSQLLWFGILFHNTPGYYHPLVLSNVVSKLTSFPFPASRVPHLATSAHLTWICALHKFCNNNNNNNSCVSLFLQIRQSILHSLTCNFCSLFLDKIKKLDILHAFLPLAIRKLSTLKNSRVFLPHPVQCIVKSHVQ